MRAKMMLMGMLVATAMAVGGCSWLRGEKEETVATDTVPAKVRDGFNREFPGAQIKNVEKETYEDGTVHYEFEYVDKSGKKGEVEFNTAGERLEEH